MVVPVYNKAPYLPETIQSIVNQQYSPLEVLIVDDGSTDNTPVVVQQLTQQFPQLGIVYLPKKNGGVSDARNYATQRATGRLILNLDGDDLINPGFITEALRLMRQRNANIVTTNVELFGVETGHWAPAEYDHYFHRYGNLIPTLVLYDREIWKTVGGYSKAFAFNEDWHIFLAAQQFMEITVAKTEQTFFRYRMLAGGLAAQFIKDSGELSVALMSTSIPALYPVEEVLKAHELLADMPERWFQRIKSQHLSYPNEWILNLWIGLVERKRGNLQVAVNFFKEAIHHSKEKDWQSMYAMALMFEPQSYRESILGLFHYVQTLRPDMKRYLTR